MLCVFSIIFYWINFKNLTVGLYIFIILDRCSKYHVNRMPFIILSIKSNFVYKFKITFVSALAFGLNTVLIFNF